MAWAIVAGAAITATGSYLAAKTTSKALKQTGDAASIEKARLLDIQNQLLEEGRPLREAQNAAAIEATEALREDVLREPGESELFKRGLTAGTKAIFSGLAPFGASDSKVAQGAIGELVSGLTAGEIENIRSGRFKLAGLGQDPTQMGLGLGGPISTAGTDVSNLALGRATGQAGFIGDITKLGTGLIEGGTFSNVADLFKNRTGTSNFGNAGFSDLPVTA